MSDKRVPVRVMFTITTVVCSGCQAPFVLFAQVQTDIQCKFGVSRLYATSKIDPPLPTFFSAIPLAPVNKRLFHGRRGERCRVHKGKRRSAIAFVSDDRSHWREFAQTSRSGDKLRRRTHLRVIEAQYVMHNGEIFHRERSNFGHASSSNGLCVRQYCLRDITSFDRCGR